ncbi:hypothetical protein LBMAG41_13560 [Cyanobium sp.]|nr:hypothetical protein LBMAG41_13560 [Cyanobium sp.]
MNVTEQILNLVRPGEEDRLSAALDEIEAEGSQPTREEWDMSHPLDRMLAAEERAEQRQATPPRRPTAPAPAEGEDADDLLADLLSPADDDNTEVADGNQATDDEIPEEYRGKSMKEVIALAEAKAKAPATGNTLPPEAYTPELGKALYGEALTGVFAAAEVNPLQLDATLRAGGDVSEAVEALTSKAGLPRSVVQTYLDGVKASSPAATPQLSDADVAAIRQSVGGDEKFKALSGWAITNLSEGELAGYNAAINSGNKELAAFAVKALQVQAAATGNQPRPRSEPQLARGGRSQGAMRFASSEQQNAAVDRRNAAGERLMHVDPTYAKRVMAAIANSPNWA